MGSLLDQLARYVARRGAEEPIAEGLSRRAVVARGLLGALAVGSLGHLSDSDVAFGAPTATCPFRSRDACFNKSASTFRRALREECDAGGASPSATLECYRQRLKGWNDLRKLCKSHCPPATPTKPKTPPRRVKRPAPPPPLPPNPYAQVGSSCLDCMAPQPPGVCCAPTPSQPWGPCGTQGVDCSVYA